APVGGDPIEPGADRRAALEPAEALPGGQQRVLQRVLGILERAEHPIAVHLELSAVRLGQRAGPPTVPRPRPGDQLGWRLFHVPSPLPGSCRTSNPVRTPAEARTGRLIEAQFPDVASPVSHVTDDPTKENRNGKDRDERSAERLARWSGPGPGR